MNLFMASVLTAMASVILSITSVPITLSITSVPTAMAPRRDTSVMVDTLALLTIKRFILMALLSAILLRDVTLEEQGSRVMAKSPMTLIGTCMLRHLFIRMATVMVLTVITISPSMQLPL